MLQGLYQVLRNQVFQGGEYQILNFFQKGSKATKPPSYIRLLYSGPFKPGEIPPGFNRMDKKRLTEKMSRLVLLLDPEKFENAFKKQYFRSYQQMVIARFLRYLNYHQLARQYAYKALKLGRHYHFQDVVANTAELLMNLASLGGKEQNFHFYKNLYKDALQKQQSEGEVKMAFHGLELHFVKGANFTNAINQSLTEGIALAYDAYQQFGTYTLMLYVTRLRTFYYELNRNFEGVLASWSEMDHYINQNPQFYHPVRQGESAIKQMVAHLNLGNANLAKPLVKEALSNIPNNSWDWFYFHQLYGLLLTRTQEYPQAYNVIKKVFAHPKFKSLPENLKENFLLLDGYLAFVAESGMEPQLTHPKIEEHGYFNLHKLINDLPHQSRDKYGVNALLVLLEVLFYLNRYDFESLYNSEDSLKVYKNRYLRHREHHRMFYFFDLLQTLLKSGMAIQATNRKAAQTLEQLKATDFLFEGGYEDFEVIPLERLWVWITRQLQDTPGKSQNKQGKTG